MFSSDEGKVLAGGTPKWRARISVSVLRNQFEIRFLCCPFCCYLPLLSFYF